MSDLVKDIECHLICPGVQPSGLSQDVMHHIIPKSVDPLVDDEDEDQHINSFPHQ